MTLKLNREYIEKHKEELARQFDKECEATYKQHEEILNKIRSGEIQGEIYPNGTAWILH